MPTHSRGLIVSYGDDSVLLATANYRGYDVSPYKDTISGISPADLGKVAWIKLDNGWYGPLLIVDAGARHHFYDLVYVKHEIAEVGNRLRALMQFTYSEQGEVYVGLCPPTADSIAVRYQPYLKFSDEGGLTWREWPRQEKPVKCDGWNSYEVFEGAQ